MVFSLSYHNLHIRIKLYFILVILLYSLYETSLDIPVSGPTSSLYRIVVIILGIGFHNFLKPVCVKRQVDEKQSFLPLPFFNNGIDAINLANIFHTKNGMNKIPPYFKGRSMPVISYSYTSLIAPKYSIIKGYCRT